MVLIEYIELVLLTLLGGFFDWYNNQIHFNFDFMIFKISFLEIPIPRFIFQFPNALLFLFLIFIIVQALLIILPSWVEKAVNGACFPFTALHAYAHIQTAKELQSDIAQTRGTIISRLDDQTKQRNIFVRTYYRVSFGGWRPESTSIFIGCNTIKDTMAVAMAPLRAGVVVFLFYMFVISPLASLMGLVGLLLHMYFSVAIFGVLMPNSADYKSIYLAMMEAGLIPKWTIYYSLAVFAFAGGNVLLLTEGDGLSALIMALLFSMVYLICLFTTIRLLVGDKELEYPLRTLVPQKAQDLFTVEDVGSFLTEDLEGG